MSKKREMILSPSLFVYKPTIESLYSILIRILGCYLFLILFLSILACNNLFFEEVFFSLDYLVGGFANKILFILNPFFFIKKIILSIILFISLIFLINHSHLGYRHSLIRGVFKGNFAYPFQR